MPAFTLTQQPGGDYILTADRIVGGKIAARRGTRYDVAAVVDGTAGGIAAANLATLLDAQHLRHAPVVPPVPEVLTPAQLRLQLARDGKSAADVEVTIAHLPEPMRTQATILFEYSLQFERKHPLVIQLAGALGYNTAAKLDAFFLAAAAL